ncbi:type II toxin-antitoxin system RelE/ParE family toxin [Candidatus Microgenomates bacterium]|nr:type II toxin-antitoxin system RelE/ParE family toxin [Candidatus Microgenomates bacterium]
MYKVKFTARAKRELKQLSKEDKLSIAIVVEDLKEDPLIGKVLGRDFLNRFSYRIGVYRIVYKVNEKDKIIEIVTAGHRSTIYN